MVTHTRTETTVNREPSQAAQDHNDTQTLLWTLFAVIVLGVLAYAAYATYYITPDTHTMPSSDQTTINSPANTTDNSTANSNATTRSANE